ncbi:MAG: hypothetical protein WD894_25780 [Pirellulales bacterium]
MFTPDDIYARIRESPFTPLRIITSSGESYDIHHPDLVLVGERLLVVGSASSKNPRYFNTTSQVSIVHISAIENLPVKAHPQGNGQE